MNTYINAIGMPVHKDKRLHRWLRKEIDSLSTKKDALDSEYPRHARQIPGPQMRRIAYRSLLDRLCTPLSTPFTE